MLKELSYLPEFEQEQIYRLVNTMVFQNIFIRDQRDEVKTLRETYLAWRKDFNELLERSDEWTDQMHDEYWSSLRDKNDTGREVNFDD